MRYSSAKVDWDSYQLYLDNSFSAFQAKLLAFFRSIGIPVSSNFLYAYFYIPCSQHFFKQYLSIAGVDDIYSLPDIFTSSLRSFRSRIPLIQVLNEESNSWVSMGFFHRHSELEKYFTFHCHYTDLNLKLRYTRYTSLRYTLSALKAFGLICLSESILYRILIVIANKGLFNYRIPFNVLASSHGVYSHSNAFVLSLAFHCNRNIVFMQPGFIHSHAKYIHQVRYELSLSNKYLTWGAQMTENSVPVGCTYTHNRTSSVKDPLFILPQVPRHTPRPFSYYWSHINDFLRIQDVFLAKIKTLIVDFPSLILRCKSCDYQYYQALLHKEGLYCFLQSGDVNNEHVCDSHDVTYVSYLSTAIPECFYKNSNVQLVMSSSDFQLKEDAQTLLSMIVKSETTSQDMLSKYISTYSFPATPPELASNIVEVLSSF